MFFRAVERKEKAEAIAADGEFFDAIDYLYILEEDTSENLADASLE